MSGYENNTGLGGVHNHYGARDTGYAVGQETRDGSVVHMRVDLTGQSLSDNFVPPVSVPNGAKFLRAMLVVDEAFESSEAEAVVDVGEQGAEGTNGVGVSLDAVGTFDVTSDLTGKWEPTSFLDELVYVGVDSGAGTWVKDQGKASVFFEFLALAKV